MSIKHGESAKLLTTTPYGDSHVYKPSTLYIVIEFNMKANRVKTLNSTFNLGAVTGLG